MTPTPVIILVRPQLGENIGAVARAMSNFGLRELRLVSPRDGWPNRKAHEMASGGQHIIKQAKLYSTLAEAASGIQVLYATTARPRDMEKPVATPRQAMETVQAEGLQAAFVFGPERTGLENEEVALADTLITIPTSPENSSLNLGQSMVVLGYEWWNRAQGGQLNIAKERHEPAGREEMAGLFSQLEGYLDEVNYYRVAHKKPIMWQNLQTMLLRGRWSEQEVRSFRGMLRALWERERRNATRKRR